MVRGSNSLDVILPLLTGSLLEVRCGNNGKSARQFLRPGRGSLQSAQMVRQLFQRTGHNLRLRSVVREALKWLAASCGPPTHPTDLV
jgi:hypothetical protein